mmetsp:Transcript_11390/g.15520  ORF Transcript_11390/g.15520 Transcript_11390/m.15520 type:complete len:255 (+) Transcript_11390:174-938(+)
MELCWLLLICVVTILFVDSKEIVVCDTTKGKVTIEMRRDWAPIGSARFLDLVESGYYTNICMFRKNKWIVQFGAVKQPQIEERAQFQSLTPILDDPPTDCGGKCRKSLLFNGALSFAGGGQNTRSDQLFFVHNIDDQPIGHMPWEVPIGNVTSGLEVIRKLYGEYDEKPDQVQIFEHGDDYIKAQFPLLDYILQCSVVGEVPPHRPFLSADESNNSVSFSFSGHHIVIVLIIAFLVYRTFISFMPRGRVINREK